jgi:hypothetical protein
MARHPTDHRTPPQGGRIRHFLRLARDGGAAWQALWRRPVPVPATNRRTVEFLRIDRGREV